MMRKVDQKMGKRVLELLGGRREDAIGIGTEGRRLEYWLRPDVDIDDFKLGGMEIYVEEGVTIKKCKSLRNKEGQSLFKRCSILCIRCRGS